MGTAAFFSRCGVGAQRRVVSFHGVCITSLTSQRRSFSARPLHCTPVDCFRKSGLHLLLLNTRRLSWFSRSNCEMSNTCDILHQTHHIGRSQPLHESRLPPRSPFLMKTHRYSHVHNTRCPQPLLSPQEPRPLSAFRLSLCACVRGSRRLPIPSLTPLFHDPCTHPPPAP
jgi:hypothetical protein